MPLFFGIHLPFGVGAGAHPDWPTPTSWPQNSLTAPPRALLHWPALAPPSLFLDRCAAKSGPIDKPAQRFQISGTFGEKEKLGWKLNLRDKAVFAKFLCLLLDAFLCSSTLCSTPWLGSQALLSDFFSPSPTGRTDCVDPILRFFQKVASSANKRRWDASPAAFNYFQCLLNLRNFSLNSPPRFRLLHFRLLGFPYPLPYSRRPQDRCICSHQRRLKKIAPSARPSLVDVASARQSHSWAPETQQCPNTRQGSTTNQ